MTTRAFVPPQFGGFGKSGLFQTYEKDSLDHTVKVISKSKSAEALTFEPTLVYAPKSAPRGAVKVAYTNRARYLSGVQVEANVQTDASKASTLALKAKNVLPKALPGLNVSLTDSTSEKDLGKAQYGMFATLAADYSRDNGALTASVTTDGANQLSVSASAAVGFEGFSLGGDAKLVKASADAPLAPKSYNAGIAYTAPVARNGAVYSGALVSDSKFEKLKVTVLAKKFNGYKSIDAGLQAKVDLQQPKVGKPQREVVFGADYRATASTTYKGALVLNTGAGVFGVEHRVPESKVALAATAVFTKPASAYSPFPITKFGVGLTFGEF